MRRITLGKPAFDETSKKKAFASIDLTLIENGVFVEAVLRLLQKSLSPEEFMNWITTPGVSELERLPGDVTYSKQIVHDLEALAAKTTPDLTLQPLPLNSGPLWSQRAIDIGHVESPKRILSPVSQQSHTGGTPRTHIS